MATGDDVLLSNQPPLESPTSTLPAQGSSIDDPVEEVASKVQHKCVLKLVLHQDAIVEPKRVLLWR